MERMILDTGVLIAMERGRWDLDQIVDDDDDVAVAGISAAELLVGVHLAEGRHGLARETWVEDLLTGLPVEDYNLAVARFHARLLAHTRRSGTTPCRT